MGKKARKTRWRALAIDTGDQSDSEESQAALHTGKTVYYQSAHAPPTHNGEGATGASNGQHQSYNAYQPPQYAHYGGVQRAYRPASGGGGGMPRGRFGHHPHHYHHHYYTRPTAPAANGIGETQSPAPSAAGANGDGKITFNEDEYTRITTPRQDVLFKKGYLSKPKTYQTQTSTGASTISTGNSTGNGTPDHQSADGAEGTDLEYESQFVFPNGFVDQNGIYYINSYEAYPLVVYNAQMCYPEYVPSASPPRSKRLSTGSLTESTSPHNEETSQELSHSGGETVNYPEYGSMYNVLLPGYYFNNGIPPEMELSHGEPRKIRKRRRRKLSKPVPEGDWTTSSSDDYDESEEMVSEIENRIIQGTHRPPAADTPPSGSERAERRAESSKDGQQVGEGEVRTAEGDDVPEAVAVEEVAEVKMEEEEEEEVEEVEVPGVEQGVDEGAAEAARGASPEEGTVKKALKADAKEFVPRYFHRQSHPHAHHHHHHHRHAPPPPPPQFLIPLPPPFLHAPPPHQHPHQPAHAMPQQHQHAHLHQPLRVLPPAAQAAPSAPAPLPPQQAQERPGQVSAPDGGAPTAHVAPATADTSGERTREDAALQQSASVHTGGSSGSGVHSVGGSKHIDIAKIVSKLEEAAKEQRRVPKVGGNQRSRRHYSRALPVELSAGRVERHSVSTSTSATALTTSSAAAASTMKNYAQMLSKKSTVTSPMKKYVHGAKVRSPSSEAPAGARAVAAVATGTPATAATYPPAAPAALPAVSTNQQAQPIKVGTAQSQWISVQSRKKRKNKSQEHEAEHCDWDERLKGASDEEIAARIAAPANDDGFESYDVSKLEDVVVVREDAPDADEQSGASDVDQIGHQLPEQQECNHVEVEAAPQPVDVQPVEFEDAPDVEVVTTQGYREAAEEEEFDKLIRTLEELEAKSPHKKKPLAGSASKRVMVTDVQMEEPRGVPTDLAKEVLKDAAPRRAQEEAKTKKCKAKSSKSKTATKEVSEGVPKQEKVLPAVAPVPAPTAAGDVPVAEVASQVVASQLVAEVVSQEVVPEIAAEMASDVVPEVVTVSNPEPPPAAPAPCHEGDSPEKKRKKKKKPLRKPASAADTPLPSIPTPPSATTSADECSYNFFLTDRLLEEERTNLEVSEELDKIIRRGMFTSLEERIKSLNITALHTAEDGFFKSVLQSTAASTKAAREDDLTTILAKTTNIFNAKRPACPRAAANEPTTTGSFLDLASLHEDPGISRGARGGPITKAVRDWMVRTREATPEVELLKSPRTILKELNASASGASSIRESWSLTPESSFEDEDLLECWDDLEDATRLRLGKSPTPEEALEVCASVCGKHADLKQIRADIEERKRNGTLPKHGGLPYSAICCSLM